MRSNRSARIHPWREALTRLPLGDVTCVTITIPDRWEDSLERRLALSSRRTVVFGQSLNKLRPGPRRARSTR